jgi:hypothetical protein
MRILITCALLAGCGGSADTSMIDGGPERDGTSGDATGGGDDDRLYPLEVGRTWTYEVVSTYASCPGGMREQRVTSSGTTDGRATFEVKGFCGLTGNTHVDGDRVEEYYDWGPVGWMRSLDAPVADGHTWQTTNGSATFGMTYASVGDTGGYADCWKVTQEVSYTSYWIYCRSVGLVRYEMIDLGGGTIRAELRSKSF